MKLRDFFCDSSFEKIIGQAIEKNPLLSVYWDRLKFDLRTIPNLSGEIYLKSNYETIYMACTSKKNPFGEIKMLMDENDLDLDPHVIQVQYSFSEKRIKITGVQIIKNPELKK